MSAILAYSVLSILLCDPSARRVSAIEAKNELFSRDHVWVRFLPQVKSYDTPYTYTTLELASMISKVSTRFSKLHLPPMHRDSYNSNSSSFNLAMTPEAAAIYNLKLKGEARPATQVMMEFPLFSHQIPAVQLSTIKGIADQANSVYKGTVQILSVTLGSYEGLKEDIERELRSVKSQLQNKENEFNYTLGAFFFATECLYEEKIKTLEGILSTVDIVFFQRRPQTGDNELAEGVTPTFNKIIDSFKICTRVVNWFSLKVPPKLAWSTGWPHHIPTRMSGNQQSNTSALGTFWQLMGGWAVASNSQLILHQAFDTFGDGGSVSWDKAGWWKLGYNDDLKSPTDYEFEEKLFSSCL